MSRRRRGDEGVGPVAGVIVDTAAGSYPQVTRDMDLQPRSAAKDVGADEYATSGPLRHPLTTADVGPSAP